MTSVISALFHDKNQEDKPVSQNKAARNKNSKKQKAGQQPASHSVQAVK